MAARVGDVSASEWVPEVQSWGKGWRSRRQDWLIVDSLTHPALGLRYEQLTEAFRPLGLRIDWGPDVASQIALGVQAYLSFELGKMSAGRESWSTKVRVLTAVTLTERPPRPVPFRGFAAHYHAFKASAAWGWGSGAAGFRRLYERGQAKPFTDVDAALGSRSWRLADIHDFAELDRAWGRAMTAGEELVGAVAFLPLLPVDVCCCFAAARRRVVLDDAGTVIDVPSLWELIAAALYLGPAHLTSVTSRWISLEADREVGARALRRRSQKRSVNTVLSGLGYLNGTIARLRSVGSALPALAAWRDAPRIETPFGLLRNNPRRTEDRTGVPLRVYRRARQKLFDDVTRLRPTRARSSDTPKTKLRYTTQLRRLLQIDLLGQLGARPSEVTRLRVKDVTASRLFPDGSTSAGVWHTPSKGKDTPIPACWRPIATQTYELIVEWVDWLGLDPAACLFGESLLAPAMMSGDFRVGALMPLPHDARHGYTPSRIRHMCAQLAVGVGRDWLERCHEYQERVSARVFEQALLTHAMKEDELGYKDLEANRELWAARTALGDPENAVVGVIEYLTGDAGARKAWDIERIREAIRGREAAAQRLADAEREIAVAERELRRLRATLTAPSRADLGGLSQRELIEHGLRQDNVRDEIERVTDKRSAASEARSSAARQQQQAAHALLDIQQAGRTIALPDSAPFSSELPDGSIAPEDETWAQALARAALTHHEVARALAEPVASGRIRNEMNIPEFAAACSVTDRTVRAWLTGHASPFPVTGTTSAVLRVTVKLRVVLIDKLPLSFLNRLLPEQLELIEQILMVPMGSTRWGGRSLDRARINATRRLLHV